MSTNRFEERRGDEQRRSPAETREAPLAPPVNQAQELASVVGNQAFVQVARQGEGILPDGRVHPGVESVIASTRGGGRALDHGPRERFGAGLGDPLDDVRVHTDDTAAALTRSVSARAFTTGSDVYFGAGEYRPGSSGGDELLAHELTHVAQQRGAPATGPLAVSEPGDALEVEAEDATRDLLG